MDKNTRRIIHFVTGGGSGATRVALDVAIGQQQNGQFEVLLLLRKKKKPLPESMQTDIRENNVQVLWIKNLWPKFRVISQIKKICREFRPDVFFAHGYSEHLWGRMAALEANVPAIVHVEHNFEKYFPFRLWQARRLALKTQATVCVSHSVLERVRQRRLAAPNARAIVNGTDFSKFCQIETPFGLNLKRAVGGSGFSQDVEEAGRSDNPDAHLAVHGVDCTTPGRPTACESRPDSTALFRLNKRPPDIVMVARFARQKDHTTLIRATRLLVDAGWKGKLFLAGSGTKQKREDYINQTRKLGLEEHVCFPGFVKDMPALLQHCRVSVLSTHYEGIPLSLAESLAAGCLVVASDVPGVRDIITDKKNGLLFPAGDAHALFQILNTVLTIDGDSQAIANQGRSDALTKFSGSRMVEEYNALCEELIRNNLEHNNPENHNS